MSVLETAASPSSSDSSPVLMEPPERHRTRSRPVEMEADESDDGDTDELEENKEEEETMTKRPSPTRSRRPSRKFPVRSADVAIASRIEGARGNGDVQRGDA
ncbi:uncharacterized protein PITG_20779 [Phytophthora infestans T30-4]|uniref:Uncharacterized protein n=1 Tax=Phytophthora infestans (strain T30-4) TaxID=403677 RepID=D0P2N3_PHYIT|nr:uncharacterized protein PITG_20779 [Phytophthora infestans T30-4]EEY56693.1 hypothetical protein PITG_20779 [Phytophthora infestans T30-4]|eukprot:XP_002895436.1 hypothetical protein PITG_20779 [Phytophthora infestans T30-4]